MNVALPDLYSWKKNLKIKVSCKLSHKASTEKIKALFKIYSRNNLEEKSTNNIILQIFDQVEYTTYLFQNNRIEQLN